MGEYADSGLIERPNGSLYSLCKLEMCLCCMSAEVHSVKLKRLVNAVCVTLKHAKKKGYFFRACFHGP